MGFLFFLGGGGGGDRRDKRSPWGEIANVFWRTTNNDVATATIEVDSPTDLHLFVVFL